MADRVVLLLIPQLRNCELAPGALGSLESQVRRGGVAEFLPAFPCLAAPAAASMLTGVGPAEHGIIGNTFYDRVDRRIVHRPFPDALVQAPRVWQTVRSARPEARVLTWFVPNTRDAPGVDFAAWIDPETGVVARPDGLVEDLCARFGPYPSMRTPPGGEPLRTAATEWILRTAAATIHEQRPDLAIIRLPVLGQVARRYGPDSPELGRAVSALERLLKPFLAGLPPRTLLLAATESIATPVTEPIYPNQLLRELGLLSLVQAPGRGGLDVDLAQSRAFALVDQQLCHIYVNDPAVAPTVAASFSGWEGEGIRTVVTPGSRIRLGLGLGHERSGEIVLIAEPDRWFAPDWWQRAGERPAALDVGSGLGRAAMVPPGSILGATGGPSPNPDYYGIIVASERGVLPEFAPLTAFDLAELVQVALR